MRIDVVSDSKSDLFLTVHAVPLTDVGDGFLLEQQATLVFGFASENYVMRTTLFPPKSNYVSALHLALEWCKYLMRKFLGSGPTVDSASKSTKSNNIENFQRVGVGGSAALLLTREEGNINFESLHWSK